MRVSRDSLVDVIAACVILCCACRSNASLFNEPAGVGPDELEAAQDPTIDPTPRPKRRIQAIPTPEPEDSISEPPETPPVKTESGKKADGKGVVTAPIEPPLDRVTEGLVLPLPSGTAIYSVRNFLQEYEPVYAKYPGLLEEYRIISTAALNGDVQRDAQKDDQDDAFSVRVKQNFERSHWAFVMGVLELLEYMQSDEKTMLANDKEVEFTKRMRGLVALAKELGAVSNEQKYVEYLRNLYISLSKRHFNRELRPIEAAE